MIGGVGDDRWPAFCAAVGMPELEQDERFANAFNRIVNIDALYALLDDKFLVKTTAEWIPVLESHDMICAPVQDYETLLDDPQALANEYVLTVEHPTNGPTQIVGVPVEVQRDAGGGVGGSAGAGAAHGGDPARPGLHVGGDRRAA